MIAFKLFSAGLILGLLPQFAAAQAQNKNLKALLFEASQNNLSPSPQRFEYRLDENQTLQLGDIRIKTSDIQISFSIPITPRQPCNGRNPFLNWVI